MSPINLTAISTDPFTVHVTWVPVKAEDMNGVPLGYRVYAYLSGVLVSTTTVQFELDSATVTSGLEPSTAYVFTACAFNSMGDGPCDACVAVTADSSKNLFLLILLTTQPVHDVRTTLLQCRFNVNLTF